MTRVADEPGIVLHTRPYRESSLIVSALTLDHGRVSVVAKGVRGRRRGRDLQPFAEGRLGWTGRTSLGTLTAFEVSEQHWFQGNRLASAFYLAELLTRLLGERESHPRLFAALHWALSTLDQEPSRTLRSFEKVLLEELGYGLDFNTDLEGRAIEDSVLYELFPVQGFAPAKAGVRGALLKGIGQERFDDPAVRRAARTLFAQALTHHLGPKPLESRKLLVREH